MPTGAEAFDGYHRRMSFSEGSRVRVTGDVDDGEGRPLRGREGTVVRPHTEADPVYAEVRFAELHDPLIVRTRDLEEID